MLEAEIDYPWPWVEEIYSKVGLGDKEKWHFFNRLVNSTLLQLFTGKLYLIYPWTVRANFSVCSYKNLQLLMNRLETHEPYTSSG